MKSVHTRLLVVASAFLASLSLPVFSQDPPPDEDPPPPKIRSVTPFSRKASFSNECPNSGGGCVITIFEDGTVTATNVGG